MPGPRLQLQGYGATNQLLNQGISNFTGAMDKYSQRVQNRANSDAISNLLGVQNNGNAQEYGNALSQIGLGYADATVVNDAKAKLLNPQLAYEKGMYGFQTDDLGNAYQYNKNTGDYSQVSSMPEGYVNPKFVTMKSVTNKTPDGVETTTQVPFNKMTGQPINTAQFQTANQQWGILRPDEIAQAKESGFNSVAEMEAGTPNAGNAVANPPMSQGNGVGVKHPKASAAEEKSRGELSSTLGSFERIKESYDKDYVGWFDKNYQGAKSNLGIGDEKFNKFQGNLRQMTNITRHALFGGALTEMEIAEWNRAAPVDTQVEEEFVPKYNAFIDASVDKMQLSGQRYLDRGDQAKAKQAFEMASQMNQYKLGGSDSKDNDVNNPNVRSVNGALYDKVEGGWERRQ